MNKKVLGRNIDDLRLKQGLSLRQFAEKIGYSNTQVVRWVNGCVAPGAEALYNVAKGLGVTIDSLFEGTEE